MTAHGEPIDLLGALQRSLRANPAWVASEQRKRDCWTHNHPNCVGTEVRGGRHQLLFIDCRSRENHPLVGD